MAAESSGRVDGEKEDEGWRSYESVFTNQKAGMDDVDRDWVKKVVYENSKNSPHFRNEQRKAEQATRRLQEMLRRKEALLSQNQLAGYDQSAAKLVAELEATRDLSHWWFHVDMDAFYASCHELMDPTLATVPMAVGGVGMISTVSLLLLAVVLASDLALLLAGQLPGQEVRGAVRYAWLHCFEAMSGPEVLPERLCALQDQGQRG